MTPENFCYWLQGYFEISGKNELNELEAKQVKEHLDLVFEKIRIKTEPVFIKQGSIVADASPIRSFDFDKITVC